jgi:hypothetical protein
MAGQEEKRTVRTFLVMVDANTIWTNEEDLSRIELLPADFKRTWEALAAGGDVTLMVPEVVLGELAYQKHRHLLRAFREARTNLAKVEATLSLAPSTVEDVSSYEIQIRVEKKLRDCAAAIPNCVFAPTPEDTIGARIGSIIEAAVWRRPPFDAGKSEKGFRDAIILETARHIQRTRQHADVALITRDGRLAEAAKQDLVRSSSNFGVYADLDSYTSFLELARGQFTPERLHAISKAAESAFATAWKHLDLDEVLRGRFHLRRGYLAVESSQGTASPAGFQSGFEVGSKTLHCVGDPTFEFLDTRLVSVVGSDEFHWSTTVGAITPYAERRGLLTTAPSEPNRYRALLAKVEWSARVDAKDDFRDFRLLDSGATFDLFRATQEEARAVVYLLS